MWDCKYRTAKDACRKRKSICFPGAKGCVLEGKFVFPFQEELRRLHRKPKHKRV